MKRRLIVFSAMCALMALAISGSAAPLLKDFVRVEGDQLVEAGKPFRFISFNVPNLLVIEDNVPFTETNPWRLPDRFELTDALATVRQLGGTVARTYVITVRRPDETDVVPRHVLGPGQFSEEAFRALDLALQAANEQGVRLIIPLVDNWVWQGGRAEYAGFRGKAKDQFWTDRQLIDDFKATLRFILNRTNSVTGIQYRDDPAILCWETGNEVDSPVAWTREIAAYIRLLDPNHLVMDGVNGSQLRAESLAMPEIDIVTTHHYPGQKGSFAELIRENAAKAKGRKPYVVGEFGFVGTEQMAEAMAAVAESGSTGGLLWSLRFRNRDGGFYWHSEPSGGNQYKAFHWPPSVIGAAYDEERLMNLVRQQAFAIRGLSVPAPALPEAPHLLPVTSPGALSWQGSVEAETYIVERAAAREGPWTRIAEKIDEARVQYRPLFSDETARRGAWFYRVRAVNRAGASRPSNVAGPITASLIRLVDEFESHNRLHSYTGALQIKDRDCRQAKEDAHRLAGGRGDEMVYKLPSDVVAIRVFAFFPKEISAITIGTSADGKNFNQAGLSQESYFHGAGDYGYWNPVLFESRNIPAGQHFVRIQFSGEIQVGRVEIDRKAE